MDAADTLKECHDPPHGCRDPDMVNRMVETIERISNPGLQAGGTGDRKKKKTEQKIYKLKPNEASPGTEQVGMDEAWWDW